MARRSIAHPPKSLRNLGTHLTRYSEESKAGVKFKTATSGWAGVMDEFYAALSVYSALSVLAVEAGEDWRPDRGGLFNALR